MSGPAGPGSRQSLAANLLLGLVTTIVVGGGAEWTARRTEKPAAPDLANWEREWHGDFYTMRSAAAGWPPWEEFNADGLRDRAHAPEKPEGVHRLICLGDSVTFGLNSRPEEAYPRILQERFDSAGPQVEVFDVALPGWSTRQERMAYERIARKYAPDVVVLGICLNDIQDLQNNLSRPPAILSALHQRSALVRRIVNARGREIWSMEELFEAKDSARVRSGFALLFGEVRLLRQAVARDGADLWVLVFPFRAQVLPAAPAPSVQQRIAAFCAAEHIPFLDALPALQGLGGQAFVEGDEIHLSPQGAERVAEEILAAGVMPAEASTGRALQRALAENRGAPDLVRLIALLHDTPTDVRAEAAWALGRRGALARAAVPALTGSLADPRESVRATAALALGEIEQDTRETDPALWKALADERQSVRWRAAEALYRIGLRPSEAIPLLSRALAGQDPYVRGFAAWELGEMGPAARPAAPALAKALLTESGALHALEVKALGRLGADDPETIAALRSALSNPRGEGRWRAARALGLLGKRGSAAVPTLIAALGDESEHVRVEAAVALGRMGAAAESAIPALGKAQRDREPGVREAATEALTRITTNPR